MLKATAWQPKSSCVTWFGTEGTATSSSTPSPEELLARLQVFVGPIGALGRCHLSRVRLECRVRTTTDGALVGLHPALADRHLAALPVRVAQLTVRSPASTPELTRA